MFDGHLRNIANLVSILSFFFIWIILEFPFQEYSIYTTFTISSLLEFPADILVYKNTRPKRVFQMFQISTFFSSMQAIYGLDLIGRRWSAFASQLLAAICSLLIPVFLGTNMVPSQKCGNETKSNFAQTSTYIRFFPNSNEKETKSYSMSGYGGCRETNNYSTLT